MFRSFNLSCRLPVGCKLMLSAALLLTSLLTIALPRAASAQTNQPNWQPTHPSSDPNADHSTNDPNTNGWMGKGFVKPESCTGQKYIGQQAVALCVATSSGYYWRWYDFNIYVCLPDEKPSFRRIEYVRETDVPCKKANWEATKTLAKSYGEDWTFDGSETITESTNATGDPPGPPGGDRPKGRNTTLSKVTNDGKVVEEETGKTETKTETPTGTKTATTESGTGGGKTEKRPRRHLTGGRPTRTHARHESEPGPQTATGGGLGGLSIGIGFGRMGGFGGHHKSDE
jgi:hypothetical protein